MDLSQKSSKIILVILFLFLIITSFFTGKYFSNTSKEFKDTLDAPIQDLKAKNDSILRINDSITVKVHEIEKVYEKTVDDIIRNNPHDDYNFFSTYIERYSSRYNSDTTKNSESNIR